MARLPPRKRVGLDSGAQAARLAFKRHAGSSHKLGRPKTPLARLPTRKRVGHLSWIIGISPALFRSCRKSAISKGPSWPPLGPWGKRDRAPRLMARACVALERQAGRRRAEMNHRAVAAGRYADRPTAPIRGPGKGAVTGQPQKVVKGVSMRHADPGHYRPPYAAEAAPPANHRPGGAELEAALRRYRAARSRSSGGYTKPTVPVRLAGRGAVRGRSDPGRPSALGGMAATSNAPHRGSPGPWRPYPTTMASDPPPAELGAQGRPLGRLLSSSIVAVVLVR